MGNLFKIVATLLLATLARASSDCSSSLSDQVPSAKALAFIQTSVAKKLLQDQRDYLWFKNQLDQCERVESVFYSSAPKNISETLRWKLAKARARKAYEKALAKSVGKNSKTQFVQRLFGSNLKPSYRDATKIAAILVYQIHLGRFAAAYLDAAITSIQMQANALPEDLPVQLARIRALLIREHATKIQVYGNYPPSYRKPEFLTERIELFLLSENIPQTVKDFLKLQNEISVAFSNQMSWPLVYLDYIRLSQQFLVLN